MKCLTMELDINNVVLFITIFEALLMAGSLSTLIKPKDMLNIDAVRKRSRIPSVGTPQTR